MTDETKEKPEPEPKNIREFERQFNSIPDEEKERIAELNPPKRPPDPPEVVIMKAGTVKDIIDNLQTALRRISDLEDTDAQMMLVKNQDYVWAKSLIKGVLAKLLGVHKKLI